MSERYEGLVEVTEVGLFGCNYLLERGYQLINVQNTSRARPHPGGQYFVQRAIRYVMGRFGDVEHVDIPPREMAPGVPQ